MLQLLILLSISTYAAATRPHVMIRTHQNTHAAGWNLNQDNLVNEDQPIHFTIFLRQQGLDKLTETFEQVSDPDSPNYGKFLTKTELDAMVYADPKAIAATTAWLAEYKTTTEITSDSIRVVSTAKEVASMLECNFHVYERYERDQKVGEHIVAIGTDHGKITVPKHIHPHIHLIVGLTELWHGRSKNINRNDIQVNKNNNKQQHVQDDTDIKVTPSVLRDYYGIPQNESNVAGDKNLQAIAAFNDYYCAECLEKFDTKHNEPTPTIDVTGVDCLDASKPCDQVESDLDVQYITSIGSGTKTLFYNTNTGWVLNFTEHAQNISPYPSVFSVSYGWAELRQCDIAFSQCNTLGYDSKQYVARANTGLQKMATLGASVMVSDGDDGAQSTSPDGSDPIDPNRWCGGSEYACYPKTSSKCAEVLLTNQTLSPPKSCPWPVGASGTLCNFLYLGDFYQDAAIEKALAAANPTCNIQIFYDGSYGVHLYSSCTCDQLAPLSHEGVVSQVYKFNSSARVFFADFPTGSPYVTSVGATMFKSSDGIKIDAEHAASIIDGAIITTGGGFSAVAPQPTWQKDAVSSWDTNAPSAAKRKLKLISVTVFFFFQLVFLTTESMYDQTPCS